jgi:AcrR family transcriptional regulator
MSDPSVLKDDLVQTQILQAARRLFQTHGFAKVTMDDFGKAIGRGRSSIYYYYKNKEEIFDAVITAEVTETLTIMVREINKATTTEQKLKAFALTRVQMLLAKGGFFLSLDSGMDADALSQFNKIKIVHHNRILQQEGELMRQILKEGIAQKEVRPMTEKELTLTIFILLSSFHGLKKELSLTNFEGFEGAINGFAQLMASGLKK